MGVIIFNGLSSADYGIKVWQAPTYSIPERDYEVIHVPGRNGDLVLDKESYKNVPRSYIVSFGSEKYGGFTNLAIKLSEWLNSCSGYARLEDSYEPDHYRMAMYKKSANITNIYHKAGQVTIEFDCKPQRFLKSGDTTKQCVNNGKIYNPTNFISRPVFKVYGNGTGTLFVGDYRVTINGINEFIIIDSELMDAYKESINCNAKISLYRNEFPKLVPGENVISFSGGITSVEVQPKWWTI